MEKSISYINVLPTTKEQIKSCKEDVITSLESEEYDVISAAIQFKAIEKLIKDIQSDVRFKDLSVLVAENNGKNYEYCNAKVEVSELGVKYDFSDCGDSILEGLEMEMNQIKHKINARQDWLKSLKESTPDVDTGELCNPPIRTSTTGIKITLK